MSKLTINTFAGIATLLWASAGPSHAQRIGYAQALDQLGRLAARTSGSICKKVNLGGGRMTECLGQNQAVSAACKASVTHMQTLIATRAQARAAVLRVCDVDIRRFCAGIQPGDGNLMECFYKAKQSISSQCRKTVADAGYEATIDASASTTQVALSPTDLINSLQGVERSAGRLPPRACGRWRSRASLTRPARIGSTARR